MPWDFKCWLLFAVCGCDQFRDLRKPPQLAGEGETLPAREGKAREGQEGGEEDEDEEERPVTLPADQHFWQVTDPAVALGLLEVRHPNTALYSITQFCDAFTPSFPGLASSVLLARKP